MPSGVEEQERRRVAAPAHLLFRVDASEPVERALEADEDPAPVADVARENARGVCAERHRERGERREEDGDLEERGERHDSFSGKRSAKTR